VDGLNLRDITVNGTCRQPILVLFDKFPALIAEVRQNFSIIVGQLLLSFNVSAGVVDLSSREFNNSAQNYGKHVNCPMEEFSAFFLFMLEGEKLYKVGELVSSRDDARKKGVPRRYKECLSMFILLSDTCIKNKLTRDYCTKLHPGTFQKYRLFLYLYVGGGVKPSPLFIHLRYTYI
jgi:hypothetical protein